VPKPGAKREKKEFGWQGRGRGMKAQDPGTEGFRGLEGSGGGGLPGRNCPFSGEESNQAGKNEIDRSG